MDEVMRYVTEGEKRGITWGLSQQLENLRLHNVCLLSHTFHIMEKKLRELETKGKAVGLKINAAKTKSMRINARSKDMFKINDKDVDEVTVFTYLGSAVTITRVTEDD
jgi:hypothetical protein